MTDVLKKLLKKQGYSFCGEHSCIKTCLWLKKAIREEDVCYKNTFYNIASHRCVQMTPAVSSCTQNCVYCWRVSEHMKDDNKLLDDPYLIVDKAIEEHRKSITGFKGNPKVSKERFEEAWNPRHFAISLSGEPLLYPLLGKMLEYIHNKKRFVYIYWIPMILFTVIEMILLVMVEQHYTIDVVLSFVCVPLIMTHQWFHNYVKFYKNKLDSYNNYDHISISL